MVHQDPEEEKIIYQTIYFISILHYPLDIVPSLSTIFTASPLPPLFPLFSSASKRSIRRFVIMEKAPTTTAFTFKTLLRHYAKRALTPQSLNVKLGPRRKGHKGWAGWLA